LFIILGDCNAKIGRENAYQKVTSKHILHDTTNGDGVLVCEYATVNGMVVARTFF